MAKAKEPEIDKPPQEAEAEDEATLAAVDEGLRDAKAGRMVSLERIRELLPKWISASSPRKER